MATKHKGFKTVQNEIAKKEGVSKKAAGAILASAARKASPAAKAKNPMLNKVKGVKKFGDGGKAKKSGVDNSTTNTTTTQKLSTPIKKYYSDTTSTLTPRATAPEIMMKSSLRNLMDAEQYNLQKGDTTNANTSYTPRRLTGDRNTKSDSEISVRRIMLKNGGKVTTKKQNIMATAKKKIAPKGKTILEKKTGEKYASKAVMAKHEKGESKKVRIAEGEIKKMKCGGKVSKMKMGGKKC
jgi:hypothetical protein